MGDPALADMASFSLELIQLRWKFKKGILLHHGFRNPMVKIMQVSASE